MTDPQNGIGLTSITAIAAGGSHSLALDSGGVVWAWGYNGYGQLGDGTLVDKNLPVKVTGITAPVIAIAAGGAFSVAVDNTGAVWAWGYNGFGQLGVDPNGNPAIPYSKTPMKVGSLSGIQAITAGLDHVLALDGSGNIWSWGYSALGQLGVGPTSTSFSSTPVQVPAFTAALITSPFTVDGVSPILAVGHHNLARQSDGKLYAWGDNSYGQLGFPPPNNLDTFKTTPQPVNNGM